MSDWALDKSKPLGDHLCDRGALSAERQRLLTSLVQEHLKQHGDDARQSLAALSPLDSAVHQQLQSVADADVTASLGHVSIVRLTTSLPAGPNVDTTLVQPPNQLPTRLRYRDLRPYARGGLGEIYIANDNELHRSVALKEIQPRYADDAESRSDRVRIAELAFHLRRGGLSARGELGYGEPAKELLRLAREEGLDLLVVGTHGHRLLSDLALGQTVSPLLHRIPIPILVVPSPARAGERDSQLLVKQPQNPN